MRKDFSRWVNGKAESNGGKWFSNAGVGRSG